MYGLSELRPALVGWNVYRWEDDIYIAGYYQDSFNSSITVDFDPGPGVVSLPYNSGTRFCFITKWDSNGDFLWVKRFLPYTGWISEGIKSIEVSNNGTVFIGGVQNRSFDADPGSAIYILTNTGNPDAFLIKLNSSGNFISAYNFGDADLSSIAVDNASNVYFVGKFENSADFDPDPTKAKNLLSAGRYDTFINKVDAAGNHVYVKQLRGRGSIRGLSIDVDSFGSIYSSGSYTQTVDFDPSMKRHWELNSGLKDAFVHRLTICNNTSSTTNVVGCKNYISPSGKYIWDTVGTYIDTIDNAAGCDSIMTLNLTLTHGVVDTSVVEFASTLTANLSGPDVSYRWLNCANKFEVLKNDTNQSFTPYFSGAFAVEITDGVCVDTSKCFNYLDIGLEETNFLSNAISIYPNPNKGSVTIDLHEKQSYVSNVTIRIRNIYGQLIDEIESVNQSVIDIKIKGPKGVYLLEIEVNNSQIFTRKVTKL